MEAILQKELILNKTACKALGVLIFVILTALGAFVRIPLPFTPVPITLQTFFVLLSGLCLGTSLGSLAQLSYVFLGVAGLPIFTEAGSGLAYLSGPTAGYLFGFILASFWLGKFRKYGGDSLFLNLTVTTLASLLILLSGIIWLKFLFGYSLAKLIIIGFIPFIPGDLLKALAASILYLRLQPRLQKIFA